MRPFYAVSFESLPTRLRSLLDQVPTDPDEREAWVERTTKQLHEPIDMLLDEVRQLREQVRVLQSSNADLQAENIYLQSRLGGRPVIKSNGNHAGASCPACSPTCDRVKQDLAYRAEIFEHVHDAIVATDEHLHITSWNRAAENLYGWKAEEVLGRNIYRVIPSDLPAETGGNTLSKLLAGETYEVEMIQYTRDGRRLWVECHGAALKDEQGNLTGFITANRDISERRALEEKNRRQRELLQAIVDSNPGGVAVVCGNSLTFKLVNEAFRAITPFPEADLIGRSLEDAWPDHEGLSIKSLLEPVVNEEASVTVERVSRLFPDGSQRWFSLHARPLMWEDQPAILLVVWETTELERALEEVKRSAREAEEVRRIFNALMEYVPEGITITAAPGARPLYISKYAEAWTGEPAGDASQDSPDADQRSIWNTYYPDGSSMVPEDEHPIIRAERFGEVVEDEELMVKQGDRDIALLCNAGPIRDGEGKIIGAVMTARDITERKRITNHQQFLGELSKSLVVLRTPEAVIDKVVHRLGEYLKLDRCFISEQGQTPGMHEIEVDYNRKGRSYAGNALLRVFPEQIIDRLNKGKIAIASDTRADPMTAHAYERLFSRLHVRSFVALPWLDPDGNWIGTLVAACSQPRAWRSDELNLLNAVADVVRLALENARLFDKLQTFRSRFEIALRSVPIIVFTTDKDLRITWIFNPQEMLSGKRLLGRRVDTLVSTLEPGVIESIRKRVLKTGQGVRKEVQITIQDGREYTGEQRLLFFDLTVEPLRNGQDEIVGFTVAALNITQQRQMEADAVRHLAHIGMQRQLIKERELERTRIAREIHDGPLQDLIATSYTLVAAREINEKELRMAKMREIQQALQTQIQELRRFCNELRPPALGPFGLGKTIRYHAESLKERHPGLSLYLDLAHDERSLPESLQMTLYRIYQELMNNVVRHAQASHVFIRFRLDEQHAVLEVADDGVGFRVPQNWLELARNGHLGLVGLRERVDIANGHVQIVSKPGCGTRVRVVVPRN